MSAPRKKYKHSQLAGNLKRLGLLPSGYNPRALSKAQRDYVVRLTHKYPGPAKHPEGFVKRTVSHATARTLKAADYNVKLKGKKPTAIFAKHGAEKITVTPKGITRESKGLKRISPFYHPKDIFEEAETFFKRRKKGQYLMVTRAGGAGGFHIHSMGAFHLYMQSLKARVTNKVGRDYWEQLRDELYIIEVK